MKRNRTNDNESAWKNVGDYGCRAYLVISNNTEFEPRNSETHIAVIQAYEDTTVESVDAACNVPIDVTGIVIPAGMCMYVVAKKVTISSGIGMLYYGADEMISG